MGNKTENKVSIHGPDITVNLNDRVELNFQYTKRKDGEVFLTGASTLPVKDIETEGFMAEGIYTPDGDESKWYIVGLYKWIDSDYDAVDYKSASAHFGYLIRRNFRFVSEFTYDFVHHYG